MSNKGEYIYEDYDNGNGMQHSEIAELSNENKDETDNYNSKEEVKSSEGESSNSENTDSNYHREEQVGMTIEVSPAAEHKHEQVKGGGDGYDTSRIHPFMLEGIVEETRRLSSAIVDRDNILSYAKVKEEKDDDLPSARDFDENLMMFGGNTIKNNKIKGEEQERTYTFKLPEIKSGNYGF